MGHLYLKLLSLNTRQHHLVDEIRKRSDKKRGEKKDRVLVPHEMSEDREQVGKRLEEALEEPMGSVGIFNRDDNPQITPAAKNTSFSMDIS
jgi:hypothetical protein